MATPIRGTNVASPIRPFTVDDRFPTAVANEIKGGLHSYTDIEDLYSIPKQRRQLFMAATVGSDIYILIKNPDTEETTRSCWKKFEGTPNSTPDNIIVRIDGLEREINEYLQFLHNVVMTKYFQTTLKTNNVNLSGEIVVPFMAKIQKFSCIFSSVKAPYNDANITLQLNRIIPKTSSIDTIGTIVLNSTTDNSFTLNPAYAVDAGTILVVSTNTPNINTYFNNDLNILVEVKQLH